MRRPWPVLALVALALPSLVPAQAPEPGPIQQLIDNARPGDILRLPPGVFNETVTIEKDLILLGSGHGYVDGGEGPAFIVRDANVRLQIVEMHSRGSPLLVQNASYFELYHLLGNFTQPPRIENTGWFRIVLPVTESPPPLDIVSTPWSHAHSVRFQLLGADGRLLMQHKVRLFDGDELRTTLLTDESGLTPGFPVAHEWASPTGSGANVTTIEVDGVAGRFTIDPHTQQTTIQTNLGASPLPFRLNPWFVGAAVVLIGLAAALDLHEGVKWRWLTTFRAYYARSARREAATKPDASEALVRHLREHPGSTLKDLRKAGFGEGLLLQELTRLEQQGRVRATQRGRWRRHVLDEGAASASPSAQG